jgi:2-iminobutanoate/2-iminopropanoate deaminase
MKREAIHVEPLSSYLARWKAPISPVTRGGGMVFVSGLPPFHPETGEILPVPIERQTEQMKLCLETVGTSLQNVMKCNICCTSAKHFATSMRSMRAISPKIRRRAFLSACRNGPGRSISRSTVSRWHDFRRESRRVAGVGNSIWFMDQEGGHPSRVCVTRGSVATRRICARQD